MIQFPGLDPDGVVYKVNLWSELTGGVPVVIGVPTRGDIDAEAVVEEVGAFARALSTRLGTDITSIIRHESVSSEVPVTGPPA
ncbi:hypothetical protein EAO70_05825 [Streptomyces sp. adm13(2018)]|uniref:hypothetical protein n=1 Tax=Streptomyces sp. adm13(2018) TaxID=2479007 RepID=UPI0011CEBDE1|nr:hypothetical protein [Streptomyces sp. adm13(2018)]TXS22379.1 hypothetical protein EAO70_05825 [Streptomyces sp. adm13(2018)]